MSTADTGTRGSRPGDLSRRRVLLLAQSAGLAAVLHHLLDPTDRLSRLGTLRELAETRALENADVVILDVPAEERAGAIGQVRRRYLGPLVVLVAKGDDTKRLGLDHATTLLTRPFSAEALGDALAPGGRQRLGPFWATIRSAAPTVVPEPAPVGPTGPGTAAAANPVVDPKAAARKAPVRPAPPTAPGQLGVVERVQRGLVALTQGWKARRRVRVAGFSAFALVAFTVAFAVASQGRCGPGCDAFGTVFSPAPTIAASQSTAPSTSGPKRSTTTTTRAAGSPGTGAYRGISGGGLTTTTRRATTTTRKPVATTRKPVATTRPAATTRPPATTKPTTPPTTAPPTTAPPTTAPPTTAGP